MFWWELREPCFLNGVLSSLLVGWWLQVILAITIVFDRDMWIDPFHSQSAMSQFIVAVTAGFFIWDFVICAMQPKKDGMAFVLHGLLCSIVYGYIALSGHMHVYGELRSITELVSCWDSIFYWKHWHIHKCWSWLCFCLRAREDRAFRPWNWSCTSRVCACLQTRTLSAYGRVFLSSLGDQYPIHTISMDTLQDGHGRFQGLHL